MLTELLLLYICKDLAANEKCDGVAVNNEAYASIKCHSGQSEQTRYLQNLNMIKTEAMKQVHGHLLTHYSVSWHWGRCGSTQKLITYNGKTQVAVRHMIDIFDSLDVQVKLYFVVYVFRANLGKQQLRILNTFS